MPLTIDWLPKHEDKVITMGKQPVADYYPPGATEPIVRPPGIPAPAPDLEEEAPKLESPKPEPPKRVVVEEPKPKQVFGRIGGKPAPSKDK